MIIIEKPKAEDVEDIQEVFYKTWLATYPNEEYGITTADIEERFKDRHSEQKIEKRKNSILNQGDNSLFLVAKDEGKLIGVMALRKEKECNELGAIYIIPEYQGKGIGKMLWNKGLEFFNNQKDIIVRVATYNKNAINFYKKLGFSDTGKRFANERHKMPISGVLIPEMEMIKKYDSKN